MGKYADYKYTKWERTFLWVMVEPYTRPKSFTPLITLYVAAFYIRVIGAAITEQLYKDTTQVKLYMMMHYGLRDSWNKLYIFKQGDIPYEFDHARPLMYSQRSDKLLLQVVCNKGFGSLVWYDLLEKNGSEVEIYNKHPRFTLSVCLESLVRLGEDDHIDGAQ